MIFRVVRKSRDKLSCQEWEFINFDFSLVLNTYAQKSRASRRHKFVVDKQHCRLSLFHVGSKQLKEDGVPLPADVVAEARQMAIDAIRVGLWQREYDGRP